MEPSVEHPIDRDQDCLEMRDLAEIQRFVRVEGPKYNCFPLSFAQERFFLADRLSAGASAYNVNLLFEINGPLNRIRLGQCLARIVGRHEILRTHFPTIDAYPIQAINAVPANVLCCVDVEGRDGADRRREAIALANAAFEQSRDLSLAPPFRPILYALGPREHLLAIATHHIVWDDASTAIFMGELRTLYESLEPNESAPLPPLHHQYADYALWQRSRVDDARRGDHLDYWRDRLTPLPDRLRFDGEHAASDASPSDRQECRQHVSSGAFAKMQELAAGEGTTLFVTLMALWRVVLHAETGQADLVLLASTSERNHPGCDKLIGPMLGMVCFRRSIDLADTFRALVKQEHQRYVDAREHAEYPLQYVFSDVPELRGKGLAHVARMVIALVDAAPASTTIDGTDWRRIHVDCQVPAKFDLMAMGIVRAGVLQCALEYDPRQFPAAMMTRLLERCVRIAALLSEQPDRPVGALVGVCEPVG
jgi:hypothetical protein